jgi:hypothetical protein
MVGEKELHFQGKGTELAQLQSKVESYLQGEGFTVQTSAPGDQGSLIQAKKGGFLSGVIAADRALTITITGDANDFTVKMGIGKWWEHLGVTAAEVLLLRRCFSLSMCPRWPGTSRSKTSWPSRSTASSVRRHRHSSRRSRAPPHGRSIGVLWLSRVRG